MQKLVGRFKKFPIGKRVVWDYTNNRLKEIILWNEKLTKFTPLTKQDVSLYFRNLRPLSCKFGEYCERCGILIGEQYQNKKLKKYNTFYICEWCYNKKRRFCKETTPDLEDIKRFGVELI